tara:strand:- start:184 stop:489 length:306 start_codon:yes stop_codon:yes gene_type:complete
MRFEPDHDPDPSRDFDDKFSTFTGISNFPAEIQKMVDTSYAKIERSVREYEDKNPDKVGPQAYMAVQDVQITAMQKELKNIFSTLLLIAKKLDEDFGNGDS